MPVKEINPISQEQLLAFLLNPHSFPHRPNHVRLKQTHSSWVLLAGPYAYEIKKPVNFGFLDFSTLKKTALFFRARGRPQPETLPRGSSGGGANFSARRHTSLWTGRRNR